MVSRLVSAQVGCWVVVGFAESEKYMLVVLYKAIVIQNCSRSVENVSSGEDQVVCFLKSHNCRCRVSIPSVQHRKWRHVTSTASHSLFTTERARDTIQMSRVFDTLEAPSGICCVREPKSLSICSGVSLCWNYL